MLGLNNIRRNFKIAGDIKENNNSFKVISTTDFVATTPDGKIVLILDATKHVDNIEEKLNMQKELLEQNAKFKVTTLYKADINGKLTEVSILNNTEMAELSKNKIKQLTTTNTTQENSEVNNANTSPIVDNTVPLTLQDMAAELDMFADLGINEDLINTPTSSISEFDWNNLKYFPYIIL